MSKVELEAVRKSFDRIGVLEDVNISVRDGEFLVFVGPSGCGKSTALRLIAGLETPSSGTIRIGDKTVNNVAAGKRNVAMVFQSYALYPHKSVAQNIGYPLKVARLPKSEIARRVQEVAATLELEDYLDRRPAQLSGGQRQRVALGRAIIRNPDVFLFDEPLSNLDADLRVTMRAELMRLHNRIGTTMIYVTHDQTEAMTMGDRIAVFAPLAAGFTHNLMQVGSPEELYARPANVFVARFLGTPKMNVLDARRQAGAITVCDQVMVDGVTAKTPETLLVGLRPEDIALDVQAETGLRGHVTLIEALGYEHVVHVETPAGLVIVRLTNRSMPPERGTTVGLSAAAGAAHFFDPKTQQRLN